MVASLDPQYPPVPFHGALCIHHVVCPGTQLCVSGSPKCLQLAACICTASGIQQRGCCMPIRALPGGSPQLHYFYVYLHVRRAMAHATELLCSFFFNATSCSEPRTKEKDIHFLGSRAGVSTPAILWGPRLSPAAVMTQLLQQ